MKEKKALLDRQKDRNYQKIKTEIRELTHPLDLNKPYNTSKVNRRH